MDSSLSEIYNLIHQIIVKANSYYSSQEKEEKNKSISLIKSLIESSFLSKIKLYKEIIYTSISGLLYYYFGAFNASNEDPSVCEEPFTKSIKYFNSLPTKVKMKFVNYYQEIFNNLGIIYYNRGEIKKGLEHFAKAEQIYNTFFLNLTKDNDNKFIFSNDLSAFLNNICDENSINMLYNFETADFEKNKKIFEHNYTLTIFYFAQAFTKLNFRKKAIHFCSVTLKRQIENNEYDLKDAVNNCINLSDFYMSNQYYAQAEYILISAISLLPEDLNKKKKLRASIQNQLGKYFLERLRFAIIRIKEQVFISDNDELNSIVNKRIFTINSLNIVWPKIEDVKNLEQAKTLFRLSNTQFKKALTYYTMDGYVTENIQINMDISQLYKLLIQFENDNNRIFAMEERRINLLEPIYNVINHKVYVMQWQEISLELAEIFSEIFESNYELLRVHQKKVTSKEIEEINSKGEKGLFYYNDIIKYIEEEYNKEEEKKIEDFITIITIKSNMARIYSKLIYNKDVKKRVESLKKSLNMYQEVYNHLKNSKHFFNERPELQDNLNMCEEMIGMLPIKIDKINRGEDL